MFFRRHTLAYVASSGRLYACGSGTMSQLGTGEKGICSVPTQVKGPFTAYRANHPHMETSDGPVYVIHRIAAGGDHCFVIASNAQVTYVMAIVI